MFPPSRLEQIRRSMGLTQEAMARLLGVSFVSVNRWEQPGASSPRGTTFEIYRALDTALRAGKSPAQILGRVPLEPGRILQRIFDAAYGRNS